MANKDLEKMSLEQLQNLQVKAYKEAYNKNWKIISDLRREIGESVFSAKCPKTTNLYESYREKNRVEYDCFNSDDPEKLKGSIKRLKDMIEQWNTVRKEENVKDVKKFLKKVEKEKAKYEEAKKDKTKLKKYIVSKIGTGAELKGKINDYSTKYKGDNEVIPLVEMKEIYGSKGVLRLICRLEEGVEGSSGDYVGVCDKIRQDYKSLKMESLLGVLAKRSNNNFDMKSASKVGSLNDVLAGLIKKLSESGVDLSKYKLYMKDINDKNSTKKTFTSEDFSDVKSDIIKLKNNLKGTDKNSETLAALKTATQKIENWESEMSHSENYIKKYNEFVNKSGKLALGYLQGEGKGIITELSKVKKNKLKNSQIVDVGKVVAMCLVAVCSKEENVIERGKGYFSIIDAYWPKQNG